MKLPSAAQRRDVVVNGRRLAYLIPAVGHWPMGEAPALFNDRLTRFLSTPATSEAARC